MSAPGKAKKRGRNEPCEVCDHFHKYEVGEVCGICGHRLPVVSDQPPVQISEYSSEILPEFLFLGDYNNASKIEHLKTQGISRILNTTVTSCKNLHLKKFTYFSLEDSNKCPFYKAIKFLEECESKRARVLVHCNNGKNRSPAIVIAYLMKYKQWSLIESYQWVKQRRPSIDIGQDYYEYLLWHQKALLRAKNKAPPTTDPSISSPNAEGVPAPTEESVKANEANPNDAGSSTIFTSSNILPPTTAPITSFPNAEGIQANQATEASVKANQAKPNAADSPKIPSTDPVFTHMTPTLSTVPDNSFYDSFLFSVYLNQLIYDAGQG